VNLLYWKLEVSTIPSVLRKNRWPRILAEIKLGLINSKVVQLCKRKLERLFVCKSQFERGSLKTGGILLIQTQTFSIVEKTLTTSSLISGLKKQNQGNVVSRKSKMS
jgi:hypothetical protein